MIAENKKHYETLRLIRNHGLVSRNKNLIFGYNSRLDTIQAVVANHLFKKIKIIKNKRIKNSLYLEKKLKYIIGLVFIERFKYLLKFFIYMNLNYKIQN